MDVHRKNRTKAIVIFIAAVLAVHFTAVLFLTEDGITRLYPFAVRAYAEELTPSGNSYAVYYNARLTVSESEIIVVGIDPSMAQSYDVLGHFIRFAKQYSNIGNIMLGSDELTTRQISRLVESTDEELQITRTNLLKSQFGISNDFADFLAELAYVNRTMTPVRKFTVSSSLDDAGNVSPDQIYAEFAAVRSQTEQTTLAVVDIALLDNTDFAAALKSRFGDRLLTLKMRYSGSETGAEESMGSALDLPFTGSGTKVYFVCGDRLNWFYNYANRMLNFFRDADYYDYASDITGDNQGFFFVVANGTPVTYEDFADESAADEMETPEV